MEEAMQFDLGDQIDVCDVCRVPIKDLAQSYTAEYGVKLFSFCQQRCFQIYLEDPAVYAEFDDDDSLE